MGSWYLAQLNIARLVAPVGDPRVAAFVSQLDVINSLAESSPGFIWRLKSGDGFETEWSDDPRMVANLSVWKSIDDLRAFTYDAQHLDALRRRGEWFEKMPPPHGCLWWIPASHTPTLAEARGKLTAYAEHGATPQAFWFGREFPPASP